MTAAPETIVVGVSGGVDSAVAAKLLKERNYKVLGLFMKNWDEDDAEGCSAADDLTYAEAVCQRLEIPLHTVNLSFEYWEQVFSEFLREYKAGRTPNPDVLCNREIKFREFLIHARRLGGSRIATGHYAGITRKDGRYHLLKGTDPNKDQSYFLYLLDQEMLGSTLFPLSSMTKHEVRKIAAAQKFSNAKRKDSTGICFIGEQQSFQQFLARFLPELPGDIIDENHQVIGQHKGIWFYTIGQRQGLGIGGRKHALEDAWYIAEKDIEGNRLLAVQGLNHPALMSQSLIANQVHWIADPPKSTDILSVKIRYRQSEQACTIRWQDDELHVHFETPQWAVTPGQSAVIYRQEYCLGGGIIQERIA